MKLPLLATVTLAACGPSPSAMTVEPVGKPLVTREAGETTVVASFLAFDDANDAEYPQPMAAHEMASVQYIDGVKIDAESLLSAAETTHPSDLHLTFLLDTSYSMVLNGQYETMLRTAASTHDKIAAEWKRKGGAFTFDLFWFRKWVFHAVGDWRSSQIASIPAPVPPAFTRLYGGAEAALEHMRAKYLAGVAAGERDRHVLVVFTDGRDNFSHESNAAYSPSPEDCPISPNGGCVTSASAPFEYLVSEPADLSTVTGAIVAHPNAKVHVLGLSNESEGELALDKEALGEIARVGQGQLMTSTDDVPALFETLSNLFVHEVSVGALLPDPAGLHEYRIDLFHANEAEPAARCTFTFDTSKAPIEVSDMTCESL